MKNTRIPIGAALIFTVFTVIMLASFAALAISTANADLALTNRAEKTMMEYYSLDKQAQTRLSQLENGENAQFEVAGESSTLYVSAKMENNQLENGTFEFVFYRWPDGVDFVLEDHHYIGRPCPGVSYGDSYSHADFRHVPVDLYYVAH